LFLVLEINLYFSQSCLIMPTTIGIADYQKLFLHTLTALIDQFPGYLVTVTATNATSLLQQLAQAQTRPDILLIDVRLPGIGGSLATSIAKAYPALRTLALMQTDDDTAVIGLLKAGWRGFVLKENLADTLEDALATLAGTGFYNGDSLQLGITRPAKGTRPTGSDPREEKAKTPNHGADPDAEPGADADPAPEAALTEVEQFFLDLACSDRSYKEIALEMGLSERVIEGFRNTLFARLQVHSRAGLALEAIRRQLITT
jgi:DNA-binding NarL/FixJ family response regulator